MSFKRASAIGGAALLAAVPVLLLSRRAALFWLEHDAVLWMALQVGAKTLTGWVGHLGAAVLGVLVPRAAANLALCRSPAMRDVAGVIDRVGRTEATVILLGESGVGKEVAARAIHEASPRRGEAFIKVNCAAIPSELLESEFFGHEKGAFTHAYARQSGHFERAHQGTLFLDEITELPLGLQAKLLHVLQDGEYYRVGGTESIRADVRVIAATNRDLAAAVQAGDFRDDLYYRLNIVQIRIPPVRERPEEVEVLTEHFRQQCEREYGRPVTIGPQTLNLFRRYPWPGNVRELETMVRRIAVLGAETPVQAELQARLVKSDGLRPVDLKTLARDAARAAEQAVILTVLRNTRWNRTQAARALGISYRALLYKIADFGLTKDADGGAEDAATLDPSSPAA
jgi:transcriptional regulator with GAF, ATPase, and Fis domain